MNAIWFLVFISLPLLVSAAPSDSEPDHHIDPNSEQNNGSIDQNPSDNDNDTSQFGEFDFFNGKKVVTLGDSFTSGTGIYKRGSKYDEEHGGKTTYGGKTYELTYRPDEECWRDMSLTPGPRYAAANNLDSVFMACKGAEIEQIANQLDLLNVVYPRYRKNEWKDSIFLLTLGGNNMRTTETESVGKLRIGELIKECMGTTNCHNERSNQISNFDAIEHLVTVFLTKLAKVATDAKIRILGYPKLMQPNSGCSTTVTINRWEADWIDDQCHTLNQRIKSAVDSVKAAHPSVDMEFVSVYSYLTHGACATVSARRHVHNLRLVGRNPSDASFHPSKKGYEAYYSAFKASL